MGVYGLVGVAVGMGVVLGQISNAKSYLSDDPLTCINCHVMTDAYATWQRGSHGHVAVCNDCHVPHGNVAAKWAFKGRDGMKHSAIFTLGLTPEVIHLSTGAKPVVRANCLRCHEQVMEKVRLPGLEERACWECHQGVHGEVHNLAGSPVELRPMVPPAGLGLFERKEGSRR